MYTANNFERVKSTKPRKENPAKGRKLNKTKRGGKAKYCTDWEV